MKILITGICGFVGSTLALALRDWRDNTEVCGIDNFSRAGSQSNLDRLRAAGIDARHGDIRVAADLAQFGEVDYLLDAAANPSVLAGVDGKTGPAELLDHNLVGTIPMLEFCRERGIPFTLLSTSRVYSIPAISAIPVLSRGKAFAPDLTTPIAGLTEHGLTEQFNTDPPVSLYGASKRCSEYLALEYAATFGFPVWINRCGVLAGAGQFGKPDQGIFSYWIHSWVQRRPLKYLGFSGSGHQVRDCLHPRDLVPLLWQQWEHGNAPGKPRLTNISGGMPSATSLAELSDWCATMDGPHSVLPDGALRPFDLPWIVLDATRAQNAWGWQPHTSKEAIFREILLHAKSRPDWLDLSGA